jgi:hypothetical protein
MPTGVRNMAEVVCLGGTIRRLPGDRDKMSVTRNLATEKGICDIRLTIDVWPDSVMRDA